MTEEVPAVKFEHHFALIPIIANLEADDAPHLVNGREGAGFVPFMLRTTTLYVSRYVRLWFMSYD